MPTPQRAAFLAFAFALALAVAGCAGAPRAPVPDWSRTPGLEEQAAGTTALLQAVSVVDSNVVWVSGHQATVLRTRDGGRTWERRPVGAPDSLQFRDVHAFDDTRAVILSAGPGDLSRIYRTDDGGATWTLAWTNPEPAGFYDCIDFWDDARGIAYGDAVDGGLRVLRTDDGGRTWQLVPQTSLPAAQEGEGGFAASGLCVETRPGGLGWIAAGNAARARVLLTSDYGRTWIAADAPVVAGPGAGLTAISMATDRLGTAFGGDLGVTDRATDNVARTEDGGRTWTLLPHVSFAGALYGGTHVATQQSVLIGVGPGGATASSDGGRSWTTLDTRAWWAVGTRDGATWVAGPNGRLARLRWPSTMP